jgi:hypothetical protein
MSNVRTYDPAVVSLPLADGYFGTLYRVRMFPATNGKWVALEDYESLQAELAQLRDAGTARSNKKATTKRVSDRSA